MESFFAHFPAQVSKAIADYAIDVAFRSSRYVFTHRVGKQQFGYCTHCNNEYKTSGLKHGNATICPECKSTCKVKASGKGRKTLIDIVYFTYYERSELNSQAIVARGIYAVRDYRFDYRKVETSFATEAMYLFELGKCQMMRRYVYYSEEKGMGYIGRWSKCSSEYSLFNQSSTAYVGKCYSRESIAEAVKGTPFSWSGWESYDYEDMVKFFSLYSKYPSIEYLTKLGFTKLVRAKLEGDQTYGAINWRGKTLFKVLKITKQELKELKSQSIYVDFWFLNLLKMNRKEGWNLTLSELSKMAAVYTYDFHLKRLREMLKYASMRDVLNYLSKQYEKSSKHFHNQTAVLGTLQDYHEECVKLEMDLTKKNVVFPGKLYEAHQKNIKKIKYKADKVVTQKIKERAKDLQLKYYFEYGGIFIRPAVSSKEIIDEGNILDHCVGGYCERHAKGLTSVFFIRDIEHPDIPYFTVEIRENKIIQCYGKKIRGVQSQPDKRVKAFIEKFTAQRLTKKAKTKIEVAIPA